MLGAGKGTRVQDFPGTKLCGLSSANTNWIRRPSARDPKHLRLNKTVHEIGVARLAQPAAREVPEAHG